MNNKIIIINGPNLNLLGEREQSQYGSITFKELREICINKSEELGLVAEFSQSNVEGELVNLIQNARKKFDGMILNAAANRKGFAPRAKIGFSQPISVPSQNKPKT